VISTQVWHWLQGSMAGPFAHPLHAGKDQGRIHLVHGDGVLQGLADAGLADKVGEFLRPIFPG
jgi:hypothetical protein